MKTAAYLVIIAACLFAVATPALATNRTVSVVFKGGTLGVGGDAVLDMNPRFGLRASASMMNFYDYDITIDDIDYNIDPNLQTVMFLLDWRPFENAFRISAGVAVNNNDFDIEGEASRPVTIGNNTYTPAEIGTLRADVDGGGVGPYVGIGVDAFRVKDGGPFLFMELGVLFGTYDVSLEADGLVALAPGFQQDLQEEEDDLQDELDSYQVYPVASLGIGFTF